MNWIEKCDFLITRNLDWNNDVVHFFQDDDNSYQLSWKDQIVSLKKNNVKCTNEKLRILVANQENEIKNGVWELESHSTYVSFFQEKVEDESFVYVDNMVFCFINNNWSYAFTPRNSKEEKNELLQEIEETIGINLRDLVETTSSISKKARKKLIRSNDNREIWDSLIDITFVQEEILSILKILIVKK